MRVGVPLGNWICYVFNGYIYFLVFNGYIYFLVKYQVSKITYPSQIEDSQLGICVSTAKVGVAGVPLGNAP